MMGARGKLCALYLAMALMALIALLFIGAFIALAAVGIQLSGEDNQCRSATAMEDCTRIYSLVGRPTENDNMKHIYVLIGCSVSGLVMSVVVSLTMWGIISAFRKASDVRKLIPKRSGGRGTSSPLTEESGHQGAAGKLGTDSTDLVEGTPGTIREDDHVEVLVDVVGAYVQHEWSKEPLRYFSVGAVLTLFLANLSAALGAICLVWGVAISYDYSRRRDEHDVSVFILVDLMIGIIMPIFFFVGAVLMSVVFSFITNNHLDGRKAVTRFLPSVRFMEAEYFNYWVIENTFFFKMTRREAYRSHGCCYACDKHRTTWILVFIVFLSLLLSFSYFVDQSVVRTQTVSKCSDVPAVYECFNSSSLAFVDCSENASASPILHCFQFLEFGRDVSVISSLAESFAFYLATVVFFQYFFVASKVLLNLWPTKLWGIPFIVLGTVMVVGAIVVLAISDTVRIELNVISVMQFFMIALFVVTVGVLLVDGRWFELIPSHKFPKPLPLVHYSTTSRSNVVEVERELTENPATPPNTTV